MNYETLKYALINGFGQSALDDFHAEPISLSLFSSKAARAALLATSRHGNFAYLLIEDTHRDLDLNAHDYLELAKELCSRSRHFYVPAQSLPAKVLLAAKSSGPVQAFKFQTL